MAQLTCQNLALGYEGRIVAERIEFSVHKGDYLCIVGENGSGKSTLIKTLLHLNKPLGGSITFGDGLTQKRIGYLPQQTVIQRDFPASVQEIVLSGTLNGYTPFYTKVQKEIAKENMGKMGISHLAKRCYRELSGGQQQRVLLARALCATQDLLLLDEPVSGLDPKVTREMYELIAQLNQEGITIIMVSHDIGAAVHYADHILHIGQEPHFFGTTEEYLKTSVGSAYAKQGGAEE